VSLIITEVHLRVIASAVPEQEWDSGGDLLRPPHLAAVDHGHIVVSDVVFCQDPSAVRCGKGELLSAPG
jgi:hypothetical protein